MWWHDLMLCVILWGWGCRLLTPAQISLYSPSLFDPPPSLCPLSYIYIYTHKHTHSINHIHTTCKQCVINRALLPALSVGVLIPLAGPASPVRSVRDELLHGSSFFLPGPSPLWPSGRNGKTSLINYLHVKAAWATYHTAGKECEGMGVCVSVCLSCSNTWQCRNVVQEHGQCACIFVSVNERKSVCSVRNLDSISS